MNRRAQIQAESHKDPDVLKREIDATRADVGQTLDALQARLSPGQLFDQLSSMVQRHGGEFAHNLGESIKQNPVPTLLTALGMAWLMTSQATGRTSVRAYEPDEGPYEPADESPGIGERLKARASAARERIAGARERMASRREHLSERAGALSESMRHAGEGARYRAQYARAGFSRMLNEQPLLVGLLGIAVGAAIGAALPASRREDELVGEARDRALQRAKAMTSETLHSARETIGAAEKPERETAGDQSATAEGVTTVDPDSPPHSLEDFSPDRP